MSGGAIDFRQIWTLIEGKQQIALLHQRAILEVHADYGARHQWPDIHLVDRLQASGIALPFTDRFEHYGGNIHLSHGSWSGVGMGFGYRLEMIAVVDDHAGRAGH